MDKLKEIMAQKKQQQAGQKWVKIGDLEKQKAEKYYQEQQELERQKQEKAQKKLEETLEYYKPQKKHQKDPITGTEVNMLEKPGETPAAENNSEQNPEKEPPIPKKEVVKKLRARKEPVTLFGETDWMRYERLCKIEKESVDHVKHEGQANIFQKDLTLNEDEFKKMIDIIDEDIPYEKLIERLEKNKKPRDYNQQEYKGRKKVSLSEGISKEDKCDDILYWCKKILKDWERELQNQGEFDNPSSESKNIIGQYRQCRRHIQPLLLLFRNRDVNEEILDALYHIVHFCILKEYVKAHDKYLEIAIGNAPWPMGVTMVGIHERSGRSKIFSSQIAHVLNDETQRKYLQAIKRLMTIAQKHEPADYSRNVNM